MDEAIMTRVCSCCAEERKAIGSKPRALKKLPDEIVQKADIEGKPLFRKKDLPIFLCPFCDGDALNRAVNTALKGGRTS